MFNISQAELWELLKRNEELAKKYRALQSEYILLKNHLLNTYSGKVLNENAIKDIRQVRRLFYTIVVCKDLSALIGS